jgi:signal recognition particle receptor subunit alpha
MSLHRQAQLSAASGASTPAGNDGANDSITAEEIAKNVEALKSKMKGGRGKGGKGTGTTPSPSPSRKSGAGAKLMRKWGDSSVSAGDMAALDYSTPAPDSPAGPATPIDVDALVSKDAMGKMGKDGQYEVADWDFRSGRAADLPSEEEILARGTSQLSIKDDDPAGTEPTSSWSGIFARLTGSKVLSQQDLQPVLAEMEKHLMDKNVAKDISEKMCDAVGAALVGKKLGGLSSECTSTNGSS